MAKEGDQKERYVKKASKIAQEKNKEDVGFIGSFVGTCLIIVKLGEWMQEKDNARWGTKERGEEINEREIKRINKFT